MERALEFIIRTLGRVPADPGFSFISSWHPTLTEWAGGGPVFCSPAEVELGC